MLWVEGPLSYVEQLCIQSFIDAGHRTILYHYGPVENVPKAAELRDGRAVLDIDQFITHGRTGSLALFSDVFRYRLLAQSNNVIWADTDAYCVRPFETETGHFFGWESDHHINGGVLGLPQNSPALQALMDMTNDEYGIPPWFSEPVKERMRARAAAGEPTHVSEMPWGVWGPHAITWHLKQTGEDRFAQPTSGLYPIPFQRRRMLTKSKALERVARRVLDSTYSVHFYGRRIRARLSHIGGRPEPGSYMDVLLEKHGIDPEQAPIPTKDTETQDE
ncbi:hypothetical protein [Oceanomicrobium pacificus]|uniref:Alpha 1,4-glycosyltransferase domain-containing protein n=1 Tax=Oceanomicrobium pacificus TaxID=2692916 RepID=A0A6B0TR14_9RHOB|nr:hypothetical protein [Oceanomicrobium pacificus]MXU65129.1 hypothetical protein [Oceanomicrobium pacificus]